MSLRWAALFAAACTVVIGACGSSSERVVVAAGTTLVDSGFLPTVIAAYERTHPEADVAVVALSSAEAFAYGQSGSADMLITHERAGLDMFLAENPQATTAVVFASEFLVAAPPGTILPMTTATDVFRAAAASGLPFVSRDDGSGTNARERLIWAEAAFDPTDEPWYTRTGSGMLSSLLIAGERGAITLAERGAFLSVAADTGLREHALESDDLLANPYDLTVVSEDRAAARFAAWLLAEGGRMAIQEANDELFGSQIYRLP